MVEPSLGPSITEFEKFKTTSEKPMASMMWLGDVLYACKFRRSTLYNRIRDGEIPKAKIYNGKSYWNKKDIDAYLKKVLGENL